MADPRRLLRLQRLEKIRTIAKQIAAREAAEAESTLAQIAALAARTGRMVADYAARADLADAGALMQIARFREGLQAIAQTAQADAGRARIHADDKLTALAEAERRRQVVEDRAQGEADAITRSAVQAPLGARRGFGTGLE